MNFDFYVLIKYLTTHRVTLPLQTRVNLRVMVMKRYSTFSKHQDWNFSISCSLIPCPRQHS